MENKEKWNKCKDLAVFPNENITCLMLLITFKNIWFLTFLNSRTCEIITHNWGS